MFSVSSLSWYWSRVVIELSAQHVVIQLALTVAFRWFGAFDSSLALARRVCCRQPLDAELLSTVFEVTTQHEPGDDAGDDHAQDVDAEYHQSVCPA